MDQRRLEQISDAWIAYHDRSEQKSEREEFWWAVEEVMDWRYDYPARLWQFILIVASRDTSDRVKGILAAGPLEDLLSKHGVRYIDRVLERARRDPSFNYLLGGVWQNTMTDEIWQKVQRARNHVW